MFDLQELNIRTNYFGDSASVDEKLNNFVGIKRNADSSKLEFCLPKGFDKFPKDNFDSLKKMFFRTYKTYRKFFEEKKELSDTKSFDGFSEFEGGYTLTGKGENIATYSKLNVFDSILDAYNELQILTLQSKLSRSSEINYSRIEKYLHRGIYLEDDAVFIDEMEIPKKIIDLDSPTLVQMFCYIYSEIKNALEENIESPRTLTLAHDFKEKYLSQHSSLFDQETFSETLTILKDTLDDIDKFTAYKDEDYWHFFEAIYTFLYGENEYENSEEGTVWGLDNFAFIWEELCYNFASTDEFTSERILFADRFGKFLSYNDFRNPFFIQINGQHKRYLRPDLVVTDNDIKSDDFIEVIGKVFQFENVELQLGYDEFVNLKLVPVFDRHNFQDLWNIYNKWVGKNPSVLKHPERNHYRNVADQHKEGFVEELMKYFYTLKTQQVLNRKPLLFNFLIVDYKYVAEELFQSYNLISERQHDIKKQLVYEMALQSGYETKKTRSQFWIPSFFENSEDVYEEVVELNSTLTDNGISVLKINFEYLQEIYLAQ